MKMIYAGLMAAVLLLTGLMNSDISFTPGSAIEYYPGDDSPDLPSGPYTIMTGNLTIEGDAELAAKSSSGTGTVNDPYIISGLDMDEYYMNITNTTSYFEITDIRWGQVYEEFGWFEGPPYRMEFRNNTHICIRNFSIDSRYQIYGHNCSDLRIIDSFFNASVNTTNPVSIAFSDLSSVKVSGSNFSSSGAYLYRHSIIDLKGPSGTTHIKDSCFSQIWLQSKIHGKQTIEECDFNNLSRITPEGMSRESEIRNNDFIGISGAGQVFLFITRNSNIHNSGTVHNNTFFSISLTPSRGIYVFGGDPRDRMIIKDNDFMNMMSGMIIFGDAGLDIHSNIFTNCSNGAIYINANQGVDMNLRIWRNRFINNKALTGTSQLYVFGTPSKVELDVNGIGNYWNDHVIPDENGDGFVDDPYVVVKNQLQDNYSVTNIHFDLDRPEASFTTISSGYLEKSYNRLEWEASDEYGITKKILNGTPFDNDDVTSLERVSVFLEEGIHNITLRAYDGNGLFREIPLDVELNDTYPIIDFTNPTDDSYVDEDPVNINWEIVDYFPVQDINLTIDGEWMHLSNSSRTRKCSLEEGYHTLSIEVNDDLNVTTEREIDFHVDVNPPSIDMNGPSPGCVLSSPYVTFDCSVDDEVGLKHTKYRFDGIEWIECEDRLVTSDLLDDGDYEFEIVSEDLAGHVTEIEVPFSISLENLVTINSPENGTHFNTGHLTLDWEYEGLFGWTDAYLRVGRKGDLVEVDENIPPLMEFPSDGEYEILLKLTDDLGNFVKSEITIIKDTTSPVVGFTGVEDGQYFKEGDLTLNWIGHDEGGIGSYHLSVDGGDWKEMGEMTSTDLDLAEGEHTLMIRVSDLAGNLETDTITINVDLTDPTLSLENGEFTIFRSPQIEINWECTDNCGISAMFLIIEGKDPVDILNRDSYVTSISSDGIYELIINATDLAGNMVSMARTIMVDLSEPRITWKEDPLEISTKNSIRLEWEIIEEMGVRELYLIVDDERIDLNISDTSVDLDLEDGTHEIEIHITDIAGWSYSLQYPESLLVDACPPMVTITETSVSESGSAIISWDSSDITAGIARVTVSIDGGSPIEIEGSSFETGQMEPGDHSIMISIEDNAGNIQEETWTFTVESKEEGDEDQGGSGILLIILIIVLLAILIAGVVGILLFISSRKLKEEKDEEDNKPDIMKTREVLMSINNKELKAAPASNGNGLSTVENEGLPPVNERGITLPGNKPSNDPDIGKK